MPARKADTAPESTSEFSSELAPETPSEIPAAISAAPLALSPEMPAELPSIAPETPTPQYALNRIAEAIESQSIALAMMADVLQRMAVKSSPSVEGLDKIEFGFGQNAEEAYAITIDCRAHTQLGSLWAIYNGKDLKGRPMPKTAIPEERLVCNLIGLKVFELPLANGSGATEKLAVLVEANGIKYELVSGLWTGSPTHNFNNWTGSMLQACAHATGDQLKSPWAISPKMGTKAPKPKADGTQSDLPIFATVRAWDGSKFVQIDSIGEPALSDYKAIIDRVNTILGYVPRSQPPNEPGGDAVDRFIDWKTEGSPLWDEAKNLGWTQPVVMQFLADQGCTFDGKGSFKGVTKSELDVIRDMLLDREVLNEYAGVNPLAGAGGRF
jgi:hypothetical protein